jgi:hypothetical protein
MARYREKVVRRYSVWQGTVGVGDEGGRSICYRLNQVFLHSAVVATRSATWQKGTIHA